MTCGERLYISPPIVGMNAIVAACEKEPHDRRPEPDMENTRHRAHVRVFRNDGTPVIAVIEWVRLAQS